MIGFFNAQENHQGVCPIGFPVPTTRLDHVSPQAVPAVYRETRLMQLSPGSHFVAHHPFPKQDFTLSELRPDRQKPFGT